MRLLDPTYIRDNVDYSFGDESGKELYNGYMKKANRSNEEFMTKYHSLRGNKPYMTLFVDNLRLYQRPNVRYTAVEDINPEVRHMKHEKLERLKDEDLLALLTTLPDMKFVIFTGFEDTPIDEAIFDKIPENVLAIYASNAIEFGGKVRPIPYGLQRRLNPNDNRQDIILQRMVDTREPTKLLYLNHSLATNPERQAINMHFGNRDWTTVQYPISHEEHVYQNYLTEIKNHKFMLCPSGNAKGCECHRDWETLYMRRVPVVVRSPYLENMFKGIPVLFVDNFMDVTDQLLRDNDHLYQQMQDFDMSKLDIVNLYNQKLSEVNTELLKKTLSIYGSHDSSAVFVDRENKIKILEYERFVKRRYALYSHKFDDKVDMQMLRSNNRERERFLWHIRDNMSNHEEIETIYWEELDTHDIEVLKTFFPNAQFVHGDWKHHTCHAASGYLTSPYTDALIISIDGGGGEDGEVVYTKTFIGYENSIFGLQTYPLDLGTSYALIGIPISEIKTTDGLFSNLLANSGKVMGLCAYGKVRYEWVEPMINYYKGCCKRGPIPSLNYLEEALSLDMRPNALSGQVSYDLAATSQYVFEKLFFDTLWDTIVHHGKNVVLVGGCALNVLLNEKLAIRMRSIGKELYVPSNPSDCGLALGQLLYFTQTRISENLAYSGMGIIDGGDFEHWKDNLSFDKQKVSVAELVDLLKKGKIIGIIEGNSEVGPRALGNRSIICDPTYAEMKDTLNKKVKFREWFRPFAPVCRLADKDLYFETEAHYAPVFPSPYMSYAPRVKASCNIPAITHVDGTSRLQTVTREDNALFYDILTEIARRAEGPAVILNTSFNMKGKPILSSYEDAFQILNTTELDYVYSNGYIFKSLA